MTTPYNIASHVSYEMEMVAQHIQNYQKIFSYLGSEARLLTVQLIFYLIKGSASDFIVANCDTIIAHMHLFSGADSFESGNKG